MKEKEIATQARMPSVARGDNWTKSRRLLAQNSSGARAMSGRWSWKLPEGDLHLDENLRSLLGYDRQERVVRWQGLVHPEDLPRMEASIWRMLTTRGRIPCQEEVRYVRRDESVLWVYVQAQAIFDANGEASVVDANHINISDRKHLERTLRTAVRQLNKRNEELSNYAFITSHDLRSPVTSMVSLVELWQEEPSAENGAFVLENIAGLSQQLLQTLDTLNEVINIKRQPDLVKGSVAVRPVFEQVYQEHLPVLLQHHAEVFADFGRCPKLFCHKPYLYRIIGNLIQNALSYNGPGRRLNINLRTEEDETEQRLIISDDGVDESRRGDRLYGFHHSFQRTPDGRGNGLFLAKAQVEAMDGRLVVATKSETGTSFTICLPKKS